MEDITFDRLQSEFELVISQIEDIVARKDIESAKKVLKQIEELVSNEEHVPLDDVEGYDHVLHKLLDNIRGKILIAEIAPNDPELQDLLNQNKENDDRINEIKARLELLRNTDGTVFVEASELDILIVDIQRQIEQLRRRTREPGVSQETIEILNAQITELESFSRELLSIEYTHGEANTQDIDKQIEEKKKEIKDLEDRIKNLGENDGRTTGEEPAEETGFSLEVIEMVNRINDLNNQIASNSAEIENMEEDFLNADKQRYDWLVNDTENAKKELSELRTRLEEVSPEAVKIMNDLEAANSQLKMVVVEMELYEERNPSVSEDETQEYNKNAEEKSRLEQEIAKLKGLLRPRTNADRSTSQPNQNQERIEELAKRIKELEGEISQLSNEEKDLQRFLDENDAEEVFIDDGNVAQGLPSREEQVRQIIEKYEAKIGFKLDPSMYEVLDDVASGDVERTNSYTDEPGTYFRVVVNKAKVQARLNEIRNQIEQKNKEKSSLEKEIDDIQNGRNSGQSDERKKLEEDLVNKRKELEELEKQKESIRKNGDKSKLVIEKESYIRMLEIKINYLKMRLQTAKDRGSEEDVQRYTEQIRTIEAQITTIRSGRVDNSDEIDKLTKELEEREAKKKEIEEKIKKIKDEKGLEGGELDLEKEARRIGDKIFKTAKIRKELESRGYTRDDFLSFYEQGREKTYQRIKELKEAYLKIKPEMENAIIEESGKMFHDDENPDVGLHRQVEAAQGNEAELIKVFEKIRKNLIKAGHEDALKKAGITGEVKTKEQADVVYGICNKIIEVIRDNYAEQAKRIEKEVLEHRNNLKVFDREIEILKKEKEAIKISQGGAEELLAEAKKEKDFRKRQLRATMYGDPELEKEWDERISRFISHKKAEGKTITYKDESGKLVSVNVDTIETYPELQDDAYFLNIEDYKAYTELTSLYDKKGLGAVKGYIDINSHEYDEYRALIEAGKTAEADKWLEGMIAAKRDYINTYHGFTNQHAVKAAVLRTAGSTLEQMLPVSGNLPLQTKLKNGLINAGRFMMIKVPKFSRQDSDGNKVSGFAEIAGGVLTTATDLLVIGGLGFAAYAGGLAGLVPAALYYGAKGIVTGANVLAGKRIQKKYSEEIKNNTPTLRKATAGDREIARRAYYRDAEKMSGIRSFFRAKLDRLPFLAKRAAETEEKILKRQEAAIDETVDTRVDNVIIDSTKNAKVAEQNQNIRIERQKEEARSAGTYNDIVRDPDSVDKEQAAATIAQNAAIHAARPEAKRMDVNPTSTVQRTEKYTKDDVEYGKTSELKELEDEGGTASVASITEEQKHRAAKERQDMINAVSTIVVAGALKGAYDFFKDGLSREVEVPDPDGTKEMTLKEWKDKKIQREVQDYKDVTTVDVDKSKKLSDYQYTDETRVDTYTAPYSSKPVQRGTDYDAVAFRWEHNGKQGEMSMAEAGSNFRIGHGGHVQYSTNMKIQDGGITEQLQELSRINPSHYQRMLSENGLSGAPIEDVVKAVESGKIQMYTQTGKLEGWGGYLGGAVKETVTQVPNGTKNIDIFVRDFDPIVVTVPDPNAVKTITKPIWDPEILAEAGKEALEGVKRGLIIGAVGKVIDEAGNIGSTTRYMDEPGIDIRTKDFLLNSKKADEGVDKYNRKYRLGKYAKGGHEEDNR